MIEKYTNYLLVFFGNIKDLDGNKIPIAFYEREKIFDIDALTLSDIYKGNYNLIPRSSLSWNGIYYDASRATNKNSEEFASINKLNLVENTRTLMPIGIPYNLSYTLSILTRGFTSTAYIIEQIASKFNPYLEFSFKELDLQDYKSLRLKLDDISFEPQEEDKFDNNEVLIDFNFTLYGYLYNDIRDVPTIQNTSLTLNEQCSAISQPCQFSI